MNSKIILAAVAMTFVAGVAAHADEYRRPQRPAQQEQQFDDEDLDEEYHRPSRYRQAPPRQEYHSREEIYCHQSRCNPPEVLPYPAPIYGHPSLPPQVSGVCTVVPGRYGGRPGWVIVLNNQVSLEGGFYEDAQRLPYVRNALTIRGVCRFLN